LRVKTAFLQRLFRQSFENQLMWWEVNRWNGTHWIWRQRAPKRVGV